MATHSGILAWRIPSTEELGRLQSMGLQELNVTESKCTAICFGKCYRSVRRTISYSVVCLDTSPIFVA